VKGQDLADIFESVAQARLARVVAASLDVARFAAYRGRTLAFAEEILGVAPWEAQRTILNAFDTHDLLAVRAATGVGKSFTMAILGLAWMCCNDQSKVITTAGTWYQVEELLWREKRAMFERSRVKLPGRMLTTQYEIGLDHVARGVSTDEPDHFRGVHAPGGVLVLIDEANAVPDAIHDACLDLMTGANCKLVMVGNPVRKSGRFYEAFAKPRWWTSKISAFDVPDPPPAKGLTTRDAIERRRELLGPSYETHPMWQSNILGDFPDEGERCLFPMSLIEAGEDLQPGAGGRHMGVDVARFGSDASVATAVIEGRVRGQHEWRKADTMTTAATVIRLAEEWEIPGENIHVDVSGVGGGVVDRLRECGLAVDAVDFGEAAVGDWDHLVGRAMRFRNRRCELHWVARRLLEDRALAIPQKYARTRADLMALSWDYAANETMTMPSKEDLRRIIGRSPDHGDSLVIALSRKANVGGKFRTYLSGARHLASRNGTH